MKKLAIVILVLGIALSYSCNKEGRMVQTTINGTLLTNGTNDKIKISAEIPHPTVKLYEQKDGPDIYANGYKEIASVTVDDNARYSFSMELNEQNTYFIGFRNLDTTIYISSPYSWSVHDETKRFNYITPGTSNNINLYCLAKSWVRPRFINTNPDPNNVDVFDTYADGIGPNENSILLSDIYTVNSFFPLKGMVDTLAPWIHKTWSGKYKYGVQKPSYAHTLEGKLTRNGVTTEVEIEYFAPPFDTSIVEIRY